ncbi:cation:proton antiporter, partial [Thermococci archaeon]
MIEYMIYTFLAINMIFNLLGSISLHRFPDV